MKKAEIKIIGSGVSGLTTGLTLLDHGYEVSIITRDHFKDTVSANAAAIWFPYEARPVDKVLEWSKNSYKKFKQLEKDPASGVSIIPFKMIEPTDITPFWLDAFPLGSELNRDIINIQDSEFISYSYLTPLIETQIYLPYLHDSFLQKGGSIHYKEIKDLEELASHCLVINCTGLGSRELCRDKELYPVQGQTVKIKPSKQHQGFAFDEFPPEYDSELSYLIPRSDCTVLGGSAFKNKESKVIDEALTQRIIDRCLIIESKLDTEQIISSHIGLRPGRTKIRLERDYEADIIHNYGHGGSGFTVSWGCANEVLNLVKNYFTQ